MGFQERAQAGHLPGDPSSSVQGQPPLLKLVVMGFALGNTTLVIEVVYPVRACDHWRVSFISHPPQMEGGRGVQNLLSDLLSFVKTEDPGHGLPGLQEDPFHTAQTELYGGLPQKAQSRQWPHPCQLLIPSVLWRVWHHPWNRLSWPCCRASGV